MTEKVERVSLEQVIEELGEPNTWWRDKASLDFDFHSPPKLRLVHLRDDDGAAPFLKLRQGWYELTYADGSKSSPFRYDTVIRRSMNASIIFAHGLLDGERVCYLRSCVRPTLLHAEPVPSHGANIWECAAGLIDKGETPQQAAKRECLEELGFDAPIHAFEPLGDFSYPAIGLMGERIYFFAVEVDPYSQRTPTLDGSPLEHGGKVLCVPMNDLYNMLKAGLIHDGKTEIAITRFMRTL